MDPVSYISYIYIYRKNTGAGKSVGARGSQYSHLDIQGTGELGLRCSSELGVTVTPNSCRNL